GCLAHYYYFTKIIYFQNPNKRVSLILCGDFNSVPSCGIYQLYTTGVSPDTLPDWKSNSNETVSNLVLEQDIFLDSACGTPPFTNFTALFADCLDYIYYERVNLEVEQVVPFPSLEELQAHTALPSIVFPSDHIALISDLRFI
ncbi:2',5'-phosphodiesterase 12-like, partial [Hyposmocoma kahamanoa]|uniref:2',5'-phosphodiesterase 12-like n=1 Tax=Hyposmocoma kahamanoa TaxID=1477025 RepID=UPI000E6D81B7